VQWQHREGDSAPPGNAQGLTARQPVWPDVHPQPGLCCKVMHIFGQQMIGRADIMRHHAIGLAHRAKRCLRIRGQKDGEDEFLEPGEAAADLQQRPAQVVHRQMGEDGEAEQVIKMVRHARKAEIRIAHQLRFRQAGAVALVGRGFELFVDVAELVDKAKLVAKLEKDIQKESAFVAKVKAKLANEAFVGSAPADIVAQERQKGADAESRVVKLTRYVEELS